MKSQIDDEQSKTVYIKGLQALRQRLQCELLGPEDNRYEEATKAWNLNVKQGPSLAIIPERVQDIILAVQFAKLVNIGVGVMATGHGVGTLCNDGLLVNTSKLRKVEIDPIKQIAKVEAGALWKDVIQAAHHHGLASLAGSAPHVGVVGYTLGGGFGYLGRKYGFNSSHVIEAEIITADGKLLQISEKENSELFWGIKGSCGNLGIITSLTFKLFPLRKVYGGAVFYPIEKAKDIVQHFAQWTEILPDEITTALAFMNFPPLPHLPEVLRGKSVVVIKGCYCGENVGLGEELFKSIRNNFSTPMLDTFDEIEVKNMDSISKDPVDPIGILQFGGMLLDLSSEAIDALIKIAGAGSKSPLLMLELRLLGGALKKDKENINLMGNQDAKFSINAIGATFTNEMFVKVNTSLTQLSDTLRPYLTSEIFANFIEVAPSEARVKSAYTPEDWEKLVTLKSKYDPLNMFRFNKNITPHKP